MKVQGGLVTSWATSWNVRPLPLVSNSQCIFSTAFHVSFLLTACRKSFLGHTLPISWSFPFHIVSVWGWFKSAALEKAYSLLCHSLSFLWNTSKAAFLGEMGETSPQCVSLWGSLTQMCFCVWRGHVYVFSPSQWTLAFIRSGWCLRSSKQWREDTELSQWGYGGSH